jgi:thioredoxin:protein disulfide reductase
MRTRQLLIPWIRLLAALLLLGAGQLARAEEDFLDPEVAFRVSARAVDERTVEVNFTIAPNYYLYREQFKFAAAGAKLGEAVLPPGKTKFDETFNKTVETYRDSVRIAIPVSQASAAFQLLVTNQGCADKGLCYPPQQRGFAVKLTGYGSDGSVRPLSATELAAATGASVNPSTSIDAATSTASTSTGGPAYAADDSRIEGALRSGKFFTIVGVFFVAGLLLSLTPCVLPMLPILSSIIVGHGAQVSRTRGLGLAASYSLGMALVYTALGVGAGLAGEGLAATLQKPWVLGVFAAGLVVLSLSMFGVYELRLPSAFTGRMASASQRLPAGRFAGVFAMGGASALIVSPCVAAPLAGALVYLSQTRDVVLGGTALFTLAAGMSVPLLLMGASAGALLPRAGGWMDEVKRCFGLLLLGVALWTVQSVLAAPLVLALWGALAIIAAALLAKPMLGHGRRSGAAVWRMAAAALLSVIGVLQLVGAASGATNPLQPLGALRVASAGVGEADAPKFTLVRSVAELDAALQAASRPVMLDFYADWCVSCKEMERFTFVDPAVRQKLAGALLLKADVTANTSDDVALLKRFRLFGPPGTIFFDAQGREIAAARIAGFQNAERFLRTLATAGL